MKYKIEDYETLWLDLISEVAKLEKRFCDYLEFPENENIEDIRREYKATKEKIKAIEHNFNLSKYDDFGMVDPKLETFRGSLQEVVACGFTERPNVKDIKAMFNATEEAGYRLNKYIKVKDGQIILN